MNACFKLPPLFSSPIYIGGHCIVATTFIYNVIMVGLLITLLNHKGVAPLVLGVLRIFKELYFAYVGPPIQKKKINK